MLRDGILLFRLLNTYFYNTSSPNPTIKLNHSIIMKVTIILREFFTCQIKCCPTPQCKYYLMYLHNIGKLISDTLMAYSRHKMSFPYPTIKT